LYTSNTSFVDCGRNGLLRLRKTATPRRESRDRGTGLQSTRDCLQYDGEGRKVLHFWPETRKLFAQCQAPLSWTLGGGDQASVNVVPAPQQKPRNRSRGRPLERAMLGRICQDRRNRWSPLDRPFPRRRAE